MRARIVIDIPDSYLARRVAEINREHAADGEPIVPPLEPRVYVRERLTAVAGDELGIALWGWPFDYKVEIEGELAGQPPPPLS